MLEELEQRSRKFTKVKVNTIKGVRYLTYEPIKDTTKFACNTQCPIGADLCRSFRDPENPNSEDSTFMDFCTRLGRLGDNNEIYGGSQELTMCCPTEGTIEENLQDCGLGDPFQELISHGKYLKLEKVIDVICKDSCPLYNKKHTKCKYDSDFCMLHDLLKNNTDE